MIRSVTKQMGTVLISGEANVNRYFYNIITGFSRLINEVLKIRNDNYLRKPV